jgi:wyosine [tRNA(Phe)-imidazoG37] synthetase (radical SAM superfamily)
MVIIWCAAPFTLVYCQNSHAVYRLVKLSKKCYEGKKNIAGAAMNYVFGPVQSRRLGLSLGIDPVQDKTCTLDCLYCQLGATATKTLERRAYARTDVVAAEVSTVIATGQPIDYITFSGTGEPTLNSDLGCMIAAIKAITPVPVAVITNSTLLHLEEVRTDLARADLVIPSLNTVNPEVFTRISRPHADIVLADMLSGLVSFSREYVGRLWVEIMLVQGINDAESELRSLARFLEGIACEKIQINTVTRPPADKNCAAVSDTVLETAQRILGPRAEIIGSFSGHTAAQSAHDPCADILALVRSHPCTIDQLCTALGLTPAPAENALRELLGQDKIEKAVLGAQTFYRASGR